MAPPPPADGRGRGRGDGDRRGRGRGQPPRKSGAPRKGPAARKGAAPRKGTGARKVAGSRGDERGDRRRGDRDGTERRERGDRERGRDPGRGRGAKGRRPPERDQEPESRAPRTWGGVARRGARNVEDGGEPGAASQAWRQAVQRSREERGDRRPPAQRPEPQDEWVDAGPVRGEAERAVDRAGGAERDGGNGDRPPRRVDRADRSRRSAPQDVADDLHRAVGGARAARLQPRLMEAARAYERERFADARRILRPIAEEARDSAAVRELHGLALYRMERWRDAAKELEAFVQLSGGSVEQHPVLADCYRALRRWDDVERLWDDLRSASPSAELVTEGRIVMAGAAADRGDIRGGIALLERGPLAAKRPKLHHLRLWYALADLYERAGDVPRARELFSRVAAHERGFADVAERLAGLG